jgi:hypothetical protein
MKGGEKMDELNEMLELVLKALRECGAFEFVGEGVTVDGELQIDVKTSAGHVRLRGEDLKDGP